MPHIPTDVRSTALRDLRWVGIAEGISFLVLLFVAVPLKHIMGMPGAVRICGMIHGILFICFVGAAIRATMTHGWPAKRFWFAMLMSILPGGTFYLDRVLKREEAA